MNILVRLLKPKHRKSDVHGNTLAWYKYSKQAIITSKQNELKMTRASRMLRLWSVISLTLSVMSKVQSQ